MLASHLDDFRAHFEMEIGRRSSEGDQAPASILPSRTHYDMREAVTSIICSTRAEGGATATRKSIGICVWTTTGNKTY